MLKYGLKNGTNDVLTVSTFLCHLFSQKCMFDEKRPQDYLS